MEGVARRVLERVYSVEIFVACLSFALVAIALIADVLGRELFGNGIFGAQKFAVFCTAIAGLLGFAVVVHAGGHLRVQAVDRVFPTSWHAPMARLGDLISAGICLFFGVYAVEFVEGAKKLGETDMVLQIPVWPIQLIVPYLFLISAVRYALYAVFPAIRPAEKEHE